MWRPGGAAQARDRSTPCRKSQAVAWCVLAVVALVNWCSTDEAFAQGLPQQNRPAGSFVVMDQLPRGMVCRAAYGELDEDREEWNPLPQWRGEKSYHPNRELQADANRQWYHFDAEGKTLGHLSQAISQTLRGKDNPLYDPIRDVGAFVVVTNCEKVRVSGKKFHYKLYLRNLSNKPGHMRAERFKDVQERFPEKIIMRAVWGGMPKTPSSRRIFKERLKCFAGPDHLYYHENPVEYPMHTIKDCTPSQNLPRRDRIKQWFRNIIPRNIEKAKQDQTYSDKYTLRRFKSFLMNQYDTMGADAAERMQLDELAFAGERQRMASTLAENEGVEVQKKKISMYIGTQIPVKRISRKR